MNELYHHGILGQKWGVRRFQNPDGTRTQDGKKRRNDDYRSYRNVGKEFEKVYGAVDEDGERGTLDSSFVKKMLNNPDYVKIMKPAMAQAKKAVELEMRTEKDLTEKEDWYQSREKLESMLFDIGKKTGFVKDESTAGIDEEYMTSAYFNFVAAEYMPHQIRITGIREEPLQDIPFEDCEREGLLKIEATATRIQRWTFKGAKRDWVSRKEAFRVLIGKVSGRKVWQQNPRVYVYSFELVK